MTNMILHVIQTGLGGEGQQQYRIKKVLDTRYQNVTVSFHKTDLKEIIPLDFPVFLDEEFIFTRNIFCLIKLAKKSDIIICHNLFNYSSLIAYLLMIFFNPLKRNLIIFHSNIDGPGSKLRTIYYKLRKTLIINFVVMFSDKLVFLTDGQRKSYKNLCPFDKKFRNKTKMVSNFLEDKYILKKKMKHFETVKILFVGRLSYFKGFHDLISLMELLKDNRHIELGVVGDGSLETNIPNYKNIEYLGSVDHKMMHEMYDDYNIFILPSYTEVFPLTILEAMARGLVIIVSDIPGMREIITEGRNGYLFPPGDIEKMKEIILFLKVNPSEIKRISNNNLKDVWEYTAEVQGKKYIEIMNELL